jgi:hypothetical protein
LILFSLGFFAVVVTHSRLTLISKNSRPEEKG